MVGIASIYESIPLRTWRRQAKANLAAPTESFKGKTVLLVGATGCILSEAIKNLADLEVSCLVFGVRNTEKAELLSDALRREHGDSLCITVLKVDLLSFASVKSFAAQISKLDRIDVVVMGSAIMNTETRMTSDGWEETLQLVHLSSALLLLLLLPKLLADGAERPVVVTSVSSTAIQTSGPMIELPENVEDSYIETVNQVKTPSFQRDYQYGVSKVAQACWVRQLSLYLPASKVQIHQLDPGSCYSPLSSENKSAQWILWWISRPVEMCARTVVNSCLPIEQSHGRLLLDYDLVPYPKYLDRAAGIQLQERVWNETRQILTAAVPETGSIYLDLLAKLQEGQPEQR